MRTYLVIAKPHPGPNVEPQLEMQCNCGKRKSLAEFVPQGVRPLRIQSINLLRLMEWAGSFAMEHASCPDRPITPSTPAHDQAAHLASFAHGDDP